MRKIKKVIHALTPYYNAKITRTLTKISDHLYLKEEKIEGVWDKVPSGAQVIDCTANVDDYFDALIKYEDYYPASEVI